MYQRYYFDLTDGLTTIRDDRGVEVYGLNMAVLYAREAVEEMRQSGELVQFGDDWQFLVRTGDGTVLATVDVSGATRLN
ncbi:hypothetical protein GMJLKIPL_1841 [Methylobacterium isbiliense]|uniref:DUF6894 domain-containing protein n=2 Tax=Methylobacterium isbiliense TaxID=315478 RepID=A0ABQ4SAD8_9HYPH|nr:hypothetical protein GMJLKIPL_1841 [Methylobacterium isbiliense]